jgi:cytochrome c
MLVNIQPGDVLNDEQQNIFEQYIKAGNGYVGVHSASDTEYDWPFYGKLVGAYFAGHPNQQKAKIEVVDKKHPATAHLPDVWERFDEWYNFRKTPENVTVLLKIDEKSYEGGKSEGGNHPMCWYHEIEGGRAFYTELGHTKESYAEPAFLKHLMGGIQYAVGPLENPKNKKKKK